MSTYAERPWTKNYDEGVPLAAEKKDGHYVESLAPGDHWFQDLLEKIRRSKTGYEGVA